MFVPFPTRSLAFWHFTVGLATNIRKLWTKTSCLHASTLPFWAQSSFTSTETARAVRDGDHGAQDGHLDFHTAPELWLSLSPSLPLFLSLSLSLFLPPSPPPPHLLSPHPSLPLSLPPSPSPSVSLTAPSSVPPSLSLFKDRLPDRHSCLNLYPCVIEVQSINQSLPPLAHRRCCFNVFDNL